MFLLEKYLISNVHVIEHDFEIQLYKSILFFTANIE